MTRYLSKIIKTNTQSIENFVAEQLMPFLLPGRPGNIMKFSRVLFWVAFLSFCLWPGTTFAARLFFSPEIMELGLDEEFATGLYLDPEGESFNAVEAEISFPTSNLIFVSALEGEGIISLWIERPQESGGIITLAGAIPGGFTGTLNPESGETEPGLITNFIFRTKKEGAEAVHVSEAKVFKNDGTGTGISPETSIFGFTVGADENKRRLEISDSTKPRFHEYGVFRSAFLEGKSVLYFEASDKESGISHFEVKEPGGDWQKAENPYILANQPPRFPIELKAIDRAGNLAIVNVENTKNTANNKYLWVLVGGGLAIILMWLFYATFKRERVRKDA